MKTFFLFLFTFIIVNQSYGQKFEQYFIDFDAYETNIIYDIPFEIHDIIDERISKTSIISEFSNKKGKIFFKIKGNLTDQFKTLIEKTYRSDSLSKLKIDIGIEYLYAYPFHFSKGSALIRLSFYNKTESQKNQNKSRQKLFQIETMANNYDVSKPKDINEKIVDAFHQGLTLFNEFINQDMVYYENNLKNDSLKNGLKKGMYYNLEGYLESLPIFDADVIIIPKKRDKIGGQLYNIIFRDQRLQKEDLSNLIWGFCDGKNEYMSVRTYQNTDAFTKIEHKGDDFFVIHHNENPKKNSELITLGVANVIGILAGALTGTYVITNFIDYNGKLVVDLKNKNIFPASREFFLQNSPNKIFKKKLRKLNSKLYKDLQYKIIDEYMRLIRERE